MDNKTKDKIIKEIERIRSYLKDTDCDNECYFWDDLYNDYTGKIIDINNNFHIEIIKTYWYLDKN